MAFWRRKKDEFVSLGLNRAADEAAPQLPPEPQPPVAASGPASGKPHCARKPNPSQPAAPWQTSVLGLDLSIEQLQAREAALEQELSARFRRAVAATRESLSEKIDTVLPAPRRSMPNCWTSWKRL